MNKISLLLLLTTLSIALPLAAAQPQSLDALLEQVKRDSILQQQQNNKREAEFIAARDNQAKLLQQAKAELAVQEARSTLLSETFQTQQQNLATQQALLQEKSGTLGELFGVVRQIAKNSGSVLDSSLVSAEKPARAEVLLDLAERKQQPTISELRQLWLAIQEEMTESGKISQFSAPVISAEGHIEQQQVTRIGVFSAFSDGHFLRYLPETDGLVELARQPVSRLRQIITDFEQAGIESGLQAVVVDPSRGAILALLVQAPDWQETIQQGGWIAYIILALGLVGLLVALVRFATLVQVNRAVLAQQKTSEISLDNPLGRILSVYNNETGSHDIETLSLQLDEAILREVPKIERGIVTLAIIAAITPMLGLLGTVSGMIETFQSITLFGTGDPKLMSGGISQALITTELGLAVAIPIMLIHSALSSKSNRLVQILDEQSAALVALNAEQQHGNTA